MDSLLIQIFPESIQTLGTVFIAFAALRVHHRVLFEHQIDEKVFREMKRERKVGLLGMFLVILGYLLNVIPLFL